jgi:hypothetical protein
MCDYKCVFSARPVRCDVMLPIKEPKMIQDMIETLAAAKVAMEENPQLKAAINNLEFNLSHVSNELVGLGQDHGSLTTAHAAAQDRIAALEAELEAARFREQAALEKLDTVVSTLKGAVNALMPVSVSIAAESGPELVEQSADVGVENVPTCIQCVGGQLDTEKAGEWPGPVDDPTSDTEFSQGKKPDMEEVSSILTQPNQFNPFDEDGKLKASETEEEVPMEGLPQRTEYEYGIPLPRTQPETTSEPNTSEMATLSAPKPFFGKPHSFKPESVSWPEWISGGGARPWWLTESELDKLREGSALAS